ncbi:MAG: hypothetical protein ACLRZ9_12770 [Eubacterium sp.]
MEQEKENQEQIKKSDHYDPLMVLLYDCLLDVENLIDIAYDNIV